MAIRDLLPSRRKERYPARRMDDNSLVSFQREINNLFDEFFRSFGAPLTRSWWPGGLFPERGERDIGRFTPQVDVSETDKEVKIVAELPGLDEKDVQVELESNLLVIKGEKREEHEEKDGEWHRVECSYGSFHRVVPLPADIDPEHAKAKFKKGRLTIAVPKKGDSRKNRKAIAISSE